MASRVARIKRIGWAQRRRFGATASAPKFFKYDAAAGLQDVALTFNKWHGAYGIDPTTGGEVILLILTDVESSSAAKIRQKRISHVQLSNGLYYEWKGAVQPIGVRQDWMISCAATGDKKVT